MILQAERRAPEPQYQLVWRTFSGDSCILSIGRFNPSITHRSCIEHEATMANDTLSSHPEQDVPIRSRQAFLDIAVSVDEPATSTQRPLATHVAGASTTTQRYLLDDRYNQECAIVWPLHVSRLLLASSRAGRDETIPVSRGEVSATQVATNRSIRMC